MKKLVVAGIAAAALYSAPALAADYPVKGSPAPMFSWTGFYFGGEAGYGWGRSHHFITSSGGTSTPYQIDGLTGGVTAGYNWQFNPNWVVGVETDFSLADIEGQGASGPGFGCGAVACKTNVDWFGTVRGRVGFTYGNALFYGTGGWAYGKVGAQLLNLCSGAGFCGNKDLGGWTAGGGLEYALDRNWSAKAEYLRVDLGNFVYATAPGGCGVSGCASVAKFNVVRIGLNYKFGSY
jgi:outer membrane immunogenic protein